MNVDSISYIIDTTVDSMGDMRNKAGWKFLIKMTFLMESNCNQVVDVSGKKLGLMQLDRDVFRTFRREYIMARPEVRKMIKDLALVDIEKENQYDVEEALIYNIALQVIVTYWIYNSRIDELPGVDTVTIAKKYLNFWKGDFHSDEEVMRCTTKFINTFLRK